MIIIIICIKMKELLIIVIFKKCHKNRKRKIIWLDPLFCKLANINVGKYLLKLIDKPLISIICCIEYLIGKL